MELGIGAGWNEVEAKAYGIDLHPTLTERFDAFDEGCEAVIGLLTNETTTLDGRYVQLVDAYCNPKPVQRPHPPICIGGQGERRTLRSVARFAQHWNYPGGPVEQFAAKLEVLRRHCDDLGRDPSEITVSTHLRGGADDVVEQAKRYGDAGLDLGIVYLPAAAHTRRARRARRCPRAVARLMAAPTPRAQTQRVQPAALRSTHVGQIG